MTDSPRNSILDAALKYHELGWGVLAVYRPTEGGCGCSAGPDCKSPGKHPLGGPSNPFDADTIPFVDWDDFNVGLTPGDPPTFFVLDVDGEAGERTLVRLLQERDNPKWPHTPTAETGGGGYHHFFKHPDFHIPNSVRSLGPGLDIRAKGGFVVAPPSSHVSGDDYQWVVPPDQPLADAPGWLLDMIKEAATPKTSQGNVQTDEEIQAAVDSTPLNERLTSAENYLRKVPAAKSGQGGNQQTLEAWGVPYSFGLTQEQAAPMMDRYNRRCKPPWSAEEFETLADNAYRYVKYPSGWRLAVGLAKRQEHLADVLSHGAVHATAGTGFNDDVLSHGGEVDAPGDAPIIFERGNAPDLAKWLLKKHGAPAGLRSIQNNCFVYDESAGIWSEYESKFLRSDLQELDERAKILSKEGEGWKDVGLSEQKINAAVKWVCHHRPIIDHEFLIDPPLGAVFPDGFVYVRADGMIDLVPHSPEHRATVGFPFRLERSPEESQAWADFMGNLFEGDSDAEQKIAALQEFVGACILGITPQYARCMMLTGEGKNGKSTFTAIIERLFPKKLRAAISPKNWGDQYYRAHFLGLRLNAVSELPEKLLVSDEFKQMITGETITGRNVTEKPFNFTPQAGHIFSVNGLPATFDNSEGFWRRFLVIPFNRNFERDPVKGGLQTKEEVVSRFANCKGSIALWGLEGASRLIENREYTMPESHYGKMEDWRYSTDAVADFVQSCCSDSSVDSAEPGLLRDLYKSFGIWAKAEGRNSLGKKKFAERLSLVSGVERLTRGAQGARFSIKVKPMGEWLDYSGPKLHGHL